MTYESFNKANLLVNLPLLSNIGVIEKVVVAIIDVKESKILERFVFEIDISAGGGDGVGTAAGGGGATASTSLPVSNEAQLRAFLLKLSVSGALLKDLRSTNGTFDCVGAKG